MYPTIGYIKKDEFDFYNKLSSFSSGEFKRMSAGAGKMEASFGFAIQYAYTTVISVIYKDKIQLNNGGYTSNTTKKWINEGLSELNYYVQQFDFDWYLIKDYNTIQGKKDLKTKLESGAVIEFRNGIYNINSQGVLEYKGF